MLLRCASLLVIPFASASPGLASSGQLDQVSPSTNAWFYCNPGDVWQQQVRAGVDGTLHSFEVTVEGPLGAQVELRLRVGDGWNVGPIEWSTLYTKTTAAQERPVLDVHAEGLVVASGDTFVVEAEGNGTGAELVGSYLHPALGPPSYPEELHLGGPGCYLDCGWRIGFRTWVRPSPWRGLVHLVTPAYPFVWLPGVTSAPTISVPRVLTSRDGSPRDPGRILTGARTHLRARPRRARSDQVPSSEALP